MTQVVTVVIRSTHNVHRTVQFMNNTGDVYAVLQCHAMPSHAIYVYMLSHDGVTAWKPQSSPAVDSHQPNSLTHVMFLVLFDNPPTRSTAKGLVLPLFYFCPLAPLAHYLFAF